MATGSVGEEAPGAPSGRYFPHLSGLNAQRLAEFVSMRLAPAATGGALTYSHLQSEWQGLVAFVSMLGVVTLMRSPRYPLELIPFASAILYVLAPPVGALVAMGISALESGHTVNNLTAGEMVAPVLGAWLVTGLGAWLTHRFRGGREIRIAVIGTHEFARSLESELEAVGVRGYRVVGCIDPKHSCPTDWAVGVKCLGSLLLLRGTVLDNGLELLVLGPLSPSTAADSDFHGEAPSRLEVFETVADACLDLPVTMIEAGQFYEQQFGHVPLGTTTSAWFQYLLHPDYRGHWPISKRLLDLAVGSVAALIAAPFVLVAAIVIKLFDGGPIFYRQTRVGERGREFDLPKLRTMRPDSDGRPEPDAELITPIGRLLRRLHVDELPQIWPVLKGEMSLVGPRPQIPSIVASFETRFTYYDRRHLLKPGITGWAQVRCGYSGTPIGEAWKLCHDLFYLKRRSLLFDLLIMLETTSTIIFPEPINRPDERFIISATADEELPATFSAAIRP